MARKWMIDEVALAGRDHLDPAYVAAYDRKSGTDPSADLRVLRRHGLNEASTLVDLGAGTGRLALAAARHCRRVVAVDVSPAMLGFLREQAAGAGLRNVECVQAGFLTYEHDGPPADFVYTRNALHHLPDFWKAMALHGISGILRPQGVLVLRDPIYDFQPSEADEKLSEWLDGAVDDPAEGYTREEFAHNVRSEHSTFRWLFEPMLTAAGFRIVEVDFRRAVYGAYTCIKR
jgi:SAM-dependent methyltransferase